MTTHQFIRHRFQRLISRDRKPEWCGTEVGHNRLLVCQRYGWKVSETFADWHLVESSSQMLTIAIKVDRTNVQIDGTSDAISDLPGLAIFASRHVPFTNLIKTIYYLKERFERFSLQKIYPSFRYRIYICT